MVDVALVLPPISKPCEPEPSVTALLPHLIRAGFSVELFDANLISQEGLVSQEFLQKAAEGLTGAPHTLAARSSRNAGRAWEALRGPKAWSDPAFYRASLDTLTQAHKSLSRSLGGRISLSDYLHPTLSPLSSADLAAAAELPDLIPTASLLSEAVDEILARDPRIIALSFTYLSQALHGWALAGLLRKKGFTGLLIAGGALITSWIRSLTPASPAFLAFDALVVGPGEKILAQISATGQIPDLPGVLAPKSGFWRPEPGDDAEISFNPEGLALDWSRYLSPGGILPVAASRGCYWSKCAFCPEARSPYRSADPVALANSIIRLAEQGGPTHVHFTDNALSPAHLKTFARFLGPAGIKWYGFARLEKNFTTPGLMDELYRGGCRMLQFGIESATPRLLELYRKGATVEGAATITRAASSAGIRVFGYFLFGAPTETEEEARTTLNWIRENSDALTFVNLSIMNLPREGEITNDPERFGVGPLEGGDGKNDLSLYAGYAGENTIDRRGIRRLLGEAKRDATLRELINRSPRGFTSNHAAFAPL